MNRGLKPQTHRDVQQRYIRWTYHLDKARDACSRSFNTFNPSFHQYQLWYVQYLHLMHTQTRSCVYTHTRMLAYTLSLSYTCTNMNTVHISNTPNTSNKRTDIISPQYNTTGRSVTNKGFNTSRNIQLNPSVILATNSRQQCWTDTAFYFSLFI